MITMIDHNRYYDGYKINSNLNYNFNKIHLEKIIAVLNQSRQTMTVPTVAHFCIYITSDFDVKTLMPRVKRVLKGVPATFVYSLEKSQKLHIHMMLVLDTAGYDDPDVLFIDTVMPAINNLKHVMNDGCVINPRNNKDSHYHNLLDLADFEDAIERYSYYAKTNQKEYVPKKFKKTFNTSQIKSKKYYDLSENNMINIRKINKTEKLKINENNNLSDFQVDIKNQKMRGIDIKLCFSLDDTTTNQPIGFYGLSYGSDITESQHEFFISIDELYISKQYANSSWDEPLAIHLSNEVKKALSKIKNNLRDDQVLSVYPIVPESAELEDLLSAVVNSVCLDLSIVTAV